MNSFELCASITKNLPSLFECSPAPIQGVRIRTPMLYPDGGIVDVFALKQGEIMRLTDFGEALSWLRMQSLSPRRSPRQRELIEDICKTLGIEMTQGQLTLDVGDGDDIAEAVIRLAQAVVRVSDIKFTFRYQRRESPMPITQPGATADHVDSWLRKKRIPFEREVKQTGLSNQDWTIDFRTSLERISLVFLLSADSRSSTRRLAEHVLAGCTDLSYLKNRDPKLMFVSLFDDTRDVWRHEDFSLVENVSEIVRWSRPNEVERVLTASQQFSRYEISGIERF